MRLPTCSFIFLTAFVGKVAGDLPSQLAADVAEYRDYSGSLMAIVEDLHVDYDDKSHISQTVGLLNLVGISINSLNTTATDLAAQAVMLAPADAAELVNQFNITANYTTRMVTALVTKTYFCLNFGGWIDSNMVPAKETINLVLHSLGDISPEPYKSQLAAPLGSLRQSLTNSYYKALVYRNWYKDFDKPCIPWGTWNL